MIPRRATGRSLSPTTSWSEAASAIFVMISNGHLQAGGNGKDRLIALSLECGDALGFGLLIRQERPLPFQIGELTYYRHPITRFHLWSAPLIAGPKPGSERWNELAIGFLAALEDRLQSPGTAHRH